jgi:nitroimidazol reductase NimA-like FMN-containing flavoprotein (pyridoxamine 5'-phosphate oxidase superfamily)
MDEGLRRKILTLLDRHRVMTLATLRPDGWPQATTVGYANEGLNIYFLCGQDSQKAANLARDNRVSLTIDDDTPQVMEITGLSMAARAQPVTDPAEAQKVIDLLISSIRVTSFRTVPKPTMCASSAAPVVISVLLHEELRTHRRDTCWEQPQRAAESTPRSLTRDASAIDSSAPTCWPRCHSASLKRWVRWRPSAVGRCFVRDRAEYPVDGGLAQL